MEKETALSTQLIAYSIVETPLPLRPAPLKRDWMDATDRRYAYRCLPLVQANVAGWELLCACACRAYWDGGSAPESVHVQSETPHPLLPTGHFGSGILTFQTGYIVRTSPGHNLWVRGPTNWGTEGLVALDAIVETDSLDYSFTVNMRFLRPGVLVRFEKGDPLALIAPVPRGYLEAITPEIRDLREDPDLQREYAAWRDARNDWNAKRQLPETEERRRGWRADYARGVTPLGSPALGHQAPAVLAPFIDRRESRG